MKRILFLIITTMILISCTDKNDNLSGANGISVPVLKPQVKLIISGYEENKQDILHFDLKYFCVDSKKNIYLLNQKTSEVLSYDLNGNYIGKFGNKGAGPGEFGSAIDFYCAEDTVCVYDFDTRRILKFYNNKFVNSKLLNYSIPLHDITPIGEGQFAAIYLDTSKIMSQDIGNMNLVLLDNSLRIIKQIQLHEISKAKEINGVPNLNPLDFKVPFAVNDSLIYIAETSRNKYEIKIFDHSGVLKNTIKKKYRKIELNKDEVDRLNEILAGTRQYGGNSGLAKDKNAINALFVDKYGSLLSFNSVFRSNEENKDKLFVDYFQNDSLIVSTVVENFIRGEDLMYFNCQIKFVDDLIYVLDIENSKLAVYDY